jgi:hypothetical protein
MESDLEKAARIVAARGSYLVKGRKMEDKIALAVADGIALGRREGLAAAANAIADAVSKLPSERN